MRAETQTIAAISLSVLALVATRPASAQSCGQLAGEIAAAQSQGALDRLDRAQRRLLDGGGGCDSKQVYCLRREISRAYVEQGYGYRKSNAPPTLLKRLGDQANKAAQTWQAAIFLAEAVESDKTDPGRFDQAAKLYQLAINDIREIEKGGELCSGERDMLPNRTQAEMIFKRATMANGLSKDFVPAPVMRDGSFGGILVDSFRGFKPEKRPIPITFEYDQARFTPKGEDAARFLLDYLQKTLAGKPVTVWLSGHTDDIGSPDYNCGLAWRRLQATHAYLVKGGIKHDAIKIVTRGEFEPVDLDDPTRYSPDEIRELNRRVELRDQAPAFTGGGGICR